MYDPKIFTGYSHQFGKTPAPDVVFTEGEPVSLGQNVSRRGRNRDKFRFSWAREATPQSLQERAIDEVHARFYEAYGAMFVSRQARQLIKAMAIGDPNAYAFLSQDIQGLRAAISSNDFPLLFGDTIDRVLLAKYRALDSDWRTYIRVRSVRDFRSVKRFQVGRGGGILGEVGVGGTYLADKPSESQYTYAVTKRGGVRNIFWEALINDDLDALSDTPDDFAYRARQTEAYIATGLFCVAGGVNTTLYATNHSFTDEDGTASTYSNSYQHAISANALAYVLGQMGNYPDDTGGGLPFSNDPLHIVVATRTMQFKVEQVLNAPTVMAVGSTDATNLPTISILPDQVRNRMQVHLNPMIRMYDTANYQTRWFLFSDLNDGYAAETGFLTGYEDPQLFMRTSNQTALSGGLASPLEGGFDDDAVRYKVRMVQGGTHTNAVGGWRFSATSYDNGVAVPNT